MICRRCQSARLIPLLKKQRDDNDVLRCRECGFIFSPPAPARGGRSSGLPRTNALESGYGGGR